MHEFAAEPTGLLRRQCLRLDFGFRPVPSLQSFRFRHDLRVERRLAVRMPVAVMKIGIVRMRVDDRLVTVPM